MKYTDGAVTQFALQQIVDYNPKESILLGQENVFTTTHPKHQIPTADPPTRSGKTVGIFNAAFMGMVGLHASRSTSGIVIFRTLTRVLR